MGELLRCDTGGWKGTRGWGLDGSNPAVTQRGRSTFTDDKQPYGGYAVEAPSLAGTIDVRWESTGRLAYFLKREFASSNAGDICNELLWQDQAG